MIDLALKWWEAVIHVLSTLHWSVAEFLVGWVGSIGVAHTLKVSLRRFTLVDADNRHLAAWLTACISASLFAFVWGVIQEPPVGSYAMIGFVALLTGIWSPIAFAGFQKFLRASPRLNKRKGFRWLPDLTGLADWLSGDVGPSKGAK